MFEHYSMHPWRKCSSTWIACWRTGSPTYSIEHDDLYEIVFFHSHMDERTRLFAHLNNHGDLDDLHSMATEEIDADVIRRRRLEHYAHTAISSSTENNDASNTMN